MSLALRHLIALQWQLYKRRWTPLSAVNAAFAAVCGYFFLGMWAARWVGADPSRHAGQHKALLLGALLVPLPFGALRAVRLLYHSSETAFLLTLPVTAADWFKARFAALFAFNALWMALWLIAAWQVQLAQDSSELFMRCLAVLPPVWLGATALQMIAALGGFALWLRGGSCALALLAALAAGAIAWPGCNSFVMDQIMRPLPDVMCAGVVEWAVAMVAALTAVWTALWMARWRHEADFSLAQTHSRRRRGGLWQASWALFGFLPRSLRAQCARDSVLLLRGGFPRALWMCAALGAVHVIFLLDASAAGWTLNDFKTRLRVLLYVVFQFSALGYVLGFDFFKYKARYLGYAHSLPLAAREWWRAHLAFVWAAGVCYMIPYWAVIALREGAAGGHGALVSLQVLALGTLLLLHACAYAVANFDGAGIPAESQYGPSAASVGIAATLLLLSPVWWLVPAGHALHLGLYRKGVRRLQRIEVLQ